MNIRQGDFLPDLYHRINTIRVELPPLREHPEDIKQIVRDSLAELKRQDFTLKLSKKDYVCLASYTWPGNVRQLFKLIKRVAYLGISVQEAITDESKQGRLEFCGQDDEQKDWLPDSFDAVEDFEEIKRKYFFRAWELSGENYSATARKIGVAVNTLRKYVESEQQD